MTRPIKGWLFVALAGLVMPISLPAHARAGTTAARTQRTPPPAAAPANLTATAGNARVVLAWEPVEGATGYGIVRGTAGVWEPTPFANVPRTTYTHAPLANGTAYSYKVAAYNRGGLGPLSNEVSATPMAPPAGLTAVAGDRQATLSWQASAGAVTYSVFRSTSSVEASFVPVATDLGTLTIVETGLTNGTTYYYRVRAVAAGGTSALSARVAAKPLPPPPASAPENVVATAGNASAMLTWDPVEGASSYRIFRKTTGAFDAVPVTKVTATTFKNASLTNGTTYSFRVTAYNMGGDGPFSAVVTVTPVAPSKAPADVTAAAGARLSTSVQWH